MSLTIENLDDIFKWIETIPGWRVHKYLMGWDYSYNNNLVIKRDAVVKLFHILYDKEYKLMEDYVLMAKCHDIIRLIFKKCNE